MNSRHGSAPSFKVKGDPFWFVLLRVRSWIVFVDRLLGYGGKNDPRNHTKQHETFVQS